MKIKELIFFLLIIGCVLIVPGPNELQQLASAVKPSFVMVIDAGHGGPDGGAEAVDGTQEKEINLKLAQALQEEASSYNVSVVMTRETNEGLFAPDNTAGRWKKLDDLQERMRIIEQANADLVISMHLNSFWSDTSVRGAQVFYPENGEEKALEISESLASAIQACLIKGLNDGSNRIEMAKDDIYIFNGVKRPTVLVECGFLSNQHDLENLKSASYQQEVARCIMDAVAEQFRLERRNVQKIST